MLTMHEIVASAKRSLSYLNVMKTYLRKTMAQERLMDWKYHINY